MRTLRTIAAIGVLAACGLGWSGPSGEPRPMCCFGGNKASGLLDLRAIERRRILPAADRFLREAPVTITAFRSPRSAGTAHDFFSEADYWWPDPANPDGPYVQRDGLSNPANFVEHRRAMIRFATQVATLTSAYRLTGDERYAAHALRHLRAWFLDDSTRMSPHLLYAQAIHGRVTGRGTGIIDTIHLVEVARSVGLLAASPSASALEIQGIRQWFADYLRWLTTHEYGIAERDAKNNHGTCWVMQVAAFAQATGDRALLDFCRQRYEQVLVPTQMAADGSFPLELARTKPYGYSLFNLDAMATICQILSPTPTMQNTVNGRNEASTSFDLWSWTTSDGRGIARAVQFLYPYMRDKSSWPFARDVMYFDAWPVRHPSLLFAGVALRKPAYLALWRSLDPEPTTEEVVRNLPIRHPLLWVE